MNKNIFTELKSNYEFLTKSEKKIAAFLLENLQKFITLSTARLSEIAGVSRGFFNRLERFNYCLVRSYGFRCYNLITL